MNPLPFLKQLRAHLAILNETIRVIERFIARPRMPGVKLAEAD